MHAFPVWTASHTLIINNATKKSKDRVKDEDDQTITPSKIKAAMIKQLKKRRTGKPL